MLDCSWQMQAVSAGPLRDGGLQALRIRPFVSSAAPAHAHTITPLSGVDIRVRVSGGGHTSQVYAIRQAIAKGLVAYYAKHVSTQRASGT
jgi:hypothetical protein